jgi:hypothetical protein
VNILQASSNVIIGDVLFRFSQIKVEEVPPTFFHLYGEPVEEDTVQFVVNSIASAINSKTSHITDHVLSKPKQRRKVSEASAYRGTILMGLSVEPCDKPAKVRKSHQKKLYLLNLKKNMATFWIRILSIGNA